MKVPTSVSTEEERLSLLLLRALNTRLTTNIFAKKDFEGRPAVFFKSSYSFVYA